MINRREGRKSSQNQTRIKKLRWKQKVISWEGIVEGRNLKILRENLILNLYHWDWCCGGRLAWDKPKGQLQVLWERWWLDETRLSEYSLKGQRHQMDKDKKMKEEHHHLVLRTLMMNCADFKEEKSAMEVLLRKICPTSQPTINQFNSLYLPNTTANLQAKESNTAGAWVKMFFSKPRIRKKRHTKKKFENIVRKSQSNVSRKSML